MAELHVQRKRNSYWLLWVIVILVLVAGGIYYYMHQNNPKDYPLPSKTTGFLMDNNKSHDVLFKLKIS